MEYISNAVIQDGERKSVHPSPPLSRGRSSDDGERTSKPPSLPQPPPSTSQQWLASLYVTFTVKFFP